MAGIAKKFLGFIGLPIEEDEETTQTNESVDFEPERPKRREFRDFRETREPREEKETKESAFSKKNNKVISVHTTTQLKVVVRTPLSFENAKDIADHLKAKKPVVINLENVDVPVAKRIIDFLSGAVYAVDGNIQKIADKIFLIVPYSVGIIGGDIKDELKNKMCFPYGS